MQLSNNFYLSEFLRSQTATRKEIDMTPSIAVIDSLTELCINILQPLRDRVGRIDISSGFRPHELNKEIGGSSGSFHVTGDAADIVSDTLSAAELFEVIKQLDLPKLDKAILEFDSWVHIQHVKPGKYARREFLLAEIENGRTVYSFG